MSGVYTYTLREDDTLDSVAEMFRVTPEKIYTWNAHGKSFPVWFDTDKTIVVGHWDEDHQSKDEQTTLQKEIAAKLKRFTKPKTVGDQVARLMLLIGEAATECNMSAVREHALTLHCLDGEWEDGI